MPDTQPLEDILEQPQQPPADPAADAPGAPQQQDAAPPAVVTRDAEPVHVPREALMDERRKRQDLERRLSEYEQHMAQQSRQPPPDWYENPQEASRHLQSTMQQQFAQEIFETRVNMGEMVMRERHQDYDEMVETFAQAAHANEHLLRQLTTHPNPSDFAYKMGKRMKWDREVGDNPDSYKSKLEAEFRAKYGIPDGDQTAPAPAPRPTSRTAPVPRSLARTTSAQPRDARTGQYTGPTPLEDIIG